MQQKYSCWRVRSDISVEGKVNGVDLKVDGYVSPLSSWTQFSLDHGIQTWYKGGQYYSPNQSKPVCIEFTQISYC
jgi:hypothetical protein